MGTSRIGKRCPWASKSAVDSVLSASMRVTRTPVPEMVLPLPVTPFRKTDPCLSSPNSATYLRGGTTANSLTPGSERGAAAADLHLLAEEAEEAEEEPKVELLEKKKMKRLVETVEVEEETRVLGKEGEALVVKVTVGLVDEHQMT